MECCESLTSSALSRRSLLLGGASFAAWAYLPKFARAADGRDPRLIVVILRGALDGLATVAPVGDPDYAGLHGSIALASAGPHAAVMLDSFFALHPSMPEFARMVRDKHAAVVHAVATPYRDRSHFDGQDVLESGYAGPGRVQSGWLNRALEALPTRRAGDERIGHRTDYAAGAAWRSTNRGLGAGVAAAGRRRYRGKADRPLPASRSGAGDGACRRACNSTRRRRATT